MTERIGSPVAVVEGMSPEAARSAWLHGIDGLPEKAVELRAHMARRQAAIAADACYLARPHVRSRKTLKALGRTSCRWASTTAVGSIDSLGARVRRRRHRTSPAVRHAQELVRAGGPFYVKVGQYVATAEGLLPHEWVEAFAWCRDEVEPMETAEARSVLAAELGRPLSEVFAWFDATPCAAASIAQAHFARLHDGTEVVVKVQRPGLRARFERDIRFLAVLCGAAHRASKRARIANLPGVLETFAQLILAELDFRLEALNMIDIGLANEAAGLDYVRVPRPIPSLVHERVLVMERLPGVPYTQARQQYGDRIDGEKIVRAFTYGVLEHTLLQGVFHGDLHAGNVLICENGDVSLVDYGIAGRVTEQQRSVLLRLLVGALRRDFAGQVEAMIELGSLPEGFDRALVVKELERHADWAFELVDRAFHEIDLTDVTRQINEGIRLLAAQGFRLPTMLALFSKNLLYLNGAMASLAPKMNLFQELEPLIMHLTTKYPNEVSGLMTAMTLPSQSTSCPKEDAVPYVFLSNEWLDAVEKLRDEIPAPPVPDGVNVDDLKVNVTVTGGPDGDVEGHLVGMQIQRGHFDGATTTITLPYDVAKSMFIEANPQAAMQAFMAGQIHVEGDMTKLMSMASAGAASFSPTSEMFALQAKLREMTV